MPLTIKTGAMKVKDPSTGNYVDVDMSLGVDYAPIISPAFTGTPSAPTPASTDDSTRIATTEFVQNHVDELEAADASLQSDLNAIHKVYYSVTEIGLSTSPKPTMTAIVQAMDDGSMAVLNQTEVDESELTTNVNTVNVILIYKVSIMRTFAFGARAYATVNYNNTRIFYASYSNANSTWYGWKEFAFTDFNPANQSLVVTNIASPMTVTLNKKGYVCRLDVGGLGSNKYTITNANPVVGVVPANAAPPDTIYFPILFRIDGTYYMNYGQIYANAGNNARNIVVHFSRSSGTVEQIICGITYITNSVD